MGLKYFWPLSVHRFRHQTMKQVTSSLQGAAPTVALVPRLELSTQLPLYFVHSQLQTEQVAASSSMKQSMLFLLQTSKADKGDNSNSKESYCHDTQFTLPLEAAQTKIQFANFSYGCCHASLLMDNFWLLWSKEL